MSLNRKATRNKNKDIGLPTLSLFSCSLSKTHDIVKSFSSYASTPFTTNAAHKCDVLYQPDSPASSLSNRPFADDSQFSSAFALGSNERTSLLEQTAFDSLPTLVNKPLSLDIEAYFNDKNSILYDKKTRRPKDKAPNAFMIYRLSQIKDLKGKQHSPVFINNVISNGWAKLHQEERARYLWLSRAFQRQLDLIRSHQSVPADKTKKRSRKNHGPLNTSLDNKESVTQEAPILGENVVFEIGFTGKLRQLMVFPQNEFLLNCAETKAC